VPPTTPARSAPPCATPSRPPACGLQRVLDLAADSRIEGGELGALLDLLPALDRGHAAAVALTDTALARLAARTQRRDQLRHALGDADQGDLHRTRTAPAPRPAAAQDPPSAGRLPPRADRDRPAAHHRHRSQDAAWRGARSVRCLLRRPSETGTVGARPADRSRPRRDRPAASRPRRADAARPARSTYVHLQVSRRVRGRTLRLRRRLVRLPRRRHRHRRRPTHHHRRWRRQEHRRRHRRRGRW
jgi:hypothetical protein